MTDWRDNLEGFLKTTARRRQEKAAYGMTDFVRDVAAPAFEEVTKELVRYGRHVTIRQADASITIMVSHLGAQEISYRVQGRMFPNGIRPFVEIRFHERKGRRLITVEKMLRGGGAEHTLLDITKDEVIRHFTATYTQYCGHGGEAGPGG